MVVSSFPHLPHQHTQITNFSITATILVDEGLKIFGVLELLTTNIQPKDQLLDFSFDILTLLESANIDFSTLFGSNTGLQSWSKGSPDWSNFSWSNSNLYLQLINAQNLPISEPLLNVKVDGTVVSFQAEFDFTENLLNDLTIAAITVGTNFTSAETVANATLFGPALIEVN